MKILVTGSSGTIGTRLCETLMGRGHDVVGADWRPNKWNPKVQAVTVDVDLRDKKKTLTLPKTDLTIHLAANARVYDLVVDPARARDNFETLFNVLEYARQRKVPKIMFSSSREVYGNTDAEILREENASVDNCESPYTASKIGGEALVRAYGRCYDMDYILFRFSNVYGMYDDSDRVIPLFIRQCKAGQDLVVFGREKMLDFTYIDDTVGGITTCAERFDEVKNEVYNLAYGEGTSILGLAEMIKELLGADVAIKVGENRTGEVVKYVADISKAKKTFGYAPKTPIREGVERSIAWYKENL